MTLREINTITPEEAGRAFERCCGSREWVHKMIRSRPFHSHEDLYIKAESIWNSLDETDWKEAFAQHPKIGDLDSLRDKFSSIRTWAEREQAGTGGAPEPTLRALAAENIEYERKFGYIFIVCASGRGADEMLSLLRARLLNQPDDEIRISAGEQWRITRLRLEKLLQVNP